MKKQPKNTEETEGKRKKVTVTRVERFETPETAAAAGAELDPESWIEQETETGVDLQARVHAVDYRDEDGERQPATYVGTLDLPLRSFDDVLSLLRRKSWVSPHGFKIRVSKIRRGDKVSEGFRLFNVRVLPVPDVDDQDADTDIDIEAGSDERIDRIERLLERVVDRSQNPTAPPLDVASLITGAGPGLMMLLKFFRSMGPSHEIIASAHKAGQELAVAAMGGPRSAAASNPDAEEASRDGWQGEIVGMAKAAMERNQKPISLKALFEGATDEDKAMFFGLIGQAVDAREATRAEQQAATETEPAQN